MHQGNLGSGLEHHKISCNWFGSSYRAISMMLSTPNLPASSIYNLSWVLQETNNMDFLAIIAFFTSKHRNLL